MSRKVRCFIAASLDGFIANAQGEVGWLFTDEDYGYSDFIVGIDALLLGHKTYQQVLSFGEWPYQDLKSYVFSSRASALDPNVVFVREEASEFIRALKREPGGDLWLVGGGTLNAACLRAGLVDELIVSVHPILLGTGVPLFEGPFESQHLTLQNSITYDSGLIQLSYTFNPSGVKVERRWDADSIPTLPEPSAVPMTEALPPVALPPVALTPLTPPEKSLQAASTSVSFPPASPPAQSLEQPDARAGMPLWGVGMGLSLVVALLSVLMVRVIDLPLLFSLLAGAGIGSVIGLLARTAKAKLSTTVTSALLSGFLALCLMQLGGAFTARSAMTEYLAGMITEPPSTSGVTRASTTDSARALQRQKAQNSLEARLSPAKTLQLYWQMQSDNAWRARYYGVGTRFKFSGRAYWLLQALEAFLLLAACAATAQFARQTAQEQQAFKAKALEHADRIRRKVLEIDPEEQADDSEPTERNTEHNNA